MAETLLEQYIKAIVVEALKKEESDFYSGVTPKKGGAKHYRVVVPKALQKVRKQRAPEPFSSGLEDNQREFLLGSLRKLPKNITAQKILRGLPLTKKEVYVLAKLMIQSGMVPIRHFKELARILVGLAFELQQNNP